MKRFFLVVLAGTLITLLALRFWPASAAARRAWLTDYEALKRFTETAYANLGDRLESRKISPKALDERTREALAAARTRTGARAAIADFVETFDDHHYRAEAPYSAARKLLRRLLGKDRARQVEVFAPGTSGEEACAAFGARDRRAGELAWAELPGWQPLPGDAVATPFPAGLLPREGEAPLAVLRIGLFSTQGFPHLCAAEWGRWRTGATGECGEACQEEFWDRLEAAFLAALERETEELAKAGASTLVVDLTGNGGGSSIVAPMARILAPRPLKNRAGAFIRHPHWVKRFAEEAAEFRTELSRGDLSAEQRAIVEAALARADALRQEAERPCDLAGIWSSAATSLPCSNIARAEPYLDYAPPGLLSGLETEGLLFGVSQYPHRESVWKGEVWIATDRATASASEDFVASLADNGAARIVGETTMGIGCGYTNGGVSLDLPAIGMTVRAPDCVRYRSDGRNEAEGIVPDVPAAWTDGDSGRERAAKVVAAIAG